MRGFLLGKARGAEPNWYQQDDPPEGLQIPPEGHL